MIKDVDEKRENIRSKQMWVLQGTAHCWLKSKISCSICNLQMPKGGGDNKIYNKKNEAVPLQKHSTWNFADLTFIPVKHCLKHGSRLCLFTSTPETVGLKVHEDQ